MQSELVQDLVSDLLVCRCVDGVLAIGQKISFLHTEPIQEVARMYSGIFSCLSFLNTDAKTAELEWLATRKHDNPVLWILGEPALSLKRWSFIQILAISTAEAVAAIDARGLGDL